MSGARLGHLGPRRRGAVSSTRPVTPRPCGGRRAACGPQMWTTTREPCPSFAGPTASWLSIVCADDECVRPEWSRRIARDVLGVEPVELPGGHFPMLALPVELTHVLTA